MTYSEETGVDKANFCEEHQVFSPPEGGAPRSPLSAGEGQRPEDDWDDDLEALIDVNLPPELEEPEAFASSECSSEETFSSERPLPSTPQAAVSEEEFTQEEVEEAETLKSEAEEHERGVINRSDSPWDSYDRRRNAQETAALLETVRSGRSYESWEQEEALKKKHRAHWASLGASAVNLPLGRDPQGEFCLLDLATPRTFILPRDLWWHDEHPGKMTFWRNIRSWAWSQGWDLFFVDMRELLNPRFCDLVLPALEESQDSLIIEVASTPLLTSKQFQQYCSNLVLLHEHALKRKKPTLWLLYKDFPRALKSHGTWDHALALSFRGKKIILEVGGDYALLPPEWPKGLGEGPQELHPRY